MTNLEILVENKLLSYDNDTNKTSAKDSNDLKKHPPKRTTKTYSTRRKKNEAQIDVNNESVLKNDSSKTGSKKRNRKVNLNKKKQEAEENENKTNRDGNKSLEECKNWHILSPVKILKNKENQIKDIKEQKIISPNHKLTEYFSDLKVECNRYVDSEKSNLNTKQNKDNDQLRGKTTSSPKLSIEVSVITRGKVRQHKQKSDIESTNHKVTEYFHVRRSNRKYVKNLIEATQKDLENKIINQIEEGLEIKEFEGKGRGIVTAKEFYKDDFVIEYIGELIDGATAKQREIKYAKNKNIGCYMYYFKHKDNQFCIDATKESGHLGRLVNHSRKGNLRSRIIEINKTPHLALFAKIDIPIGTEILYDYGDRNQVSVQHHPWLCM